VVRTSAGRRVVDEGGMLRERVEELRSRLHAAGTLDLALVHHWEGVGMSLPPSLCSEELFRGDPNPPRINFRCLEFASQVALVEAGAAVALVPRLGRGQLPAGVVAVPVREPVPTRPITLIWRATMTEAPAVRAIRALLTASTATSQPAAAELSAAALSPVAAP